VNGMSSTPDVSAPSAVTVMLRDMIRYKASI
jgi:hypothetical protein